MGRRRRAVADAEPYFKSIAYTCPQRSNVADFIMDVVSGVVRTDGGGPTGAADAIQAKLVQLWARKHPPAPVQLESPGARAALDAASAAPDSDKGLRDAKVVMKRLLLRTMRGKRAVLVDWLQMCARARPAR